MADFTIDANRPGSFDESVGNNGTDDRVTVNIGPDFLGSINVNSSPRDGEIDYAEVNLPDGWRLVPTFSPELGNEDPAHRVWHYLVMNDRNLPVGTVRIGSNNDPRQGIPCFLCGTMIETPQGPVAIEDLVPGDLVLTRDRGAQPLRWIGSRGLSGRELAAAPHLVPIRIRAGALAAGVPAADLLVSP